VVSLPRRRRLFRGDGEGEPDVPKAELANGLPLKWLDTSKAEGGGVEGAIVEKVVSAESGSSGGVGDCFSVGSGQGEVRWGSEGGVGGRACDEQSGEPWSTTEDWELTQVSGIEVSRYEPNGSRGSG
jgi:hypothetical protein